MKTHHTGHKRGFSHRGKEDLQSISVLNMKPGQCFPSKMGKN